VPLANFTCKVLHFFFKANLMSLAATFGLNRIFILQI
jgi:hypothetical protein